MSLRSYLLPCQTNRGLKIESSNKQKGREKWLPVNAVSHEIVSPRDPASGLPTGKRQHKPLEIVSDIDRVLPMLHQALTQNDTFKTMEFQFWVNRKMDAIGSAAGAEVMAYKIVLTNATLSALQTTQLNVTNPDLMKYETHFRASFTYQKIEWTWVDGGIMANDDWEAPVV